jgi:hypothetical protein
MLPSGRAADAADLAQSEAAGLIGRPVAPTSGVPRGASS